MLNRKKGKIPFVNGGRPFPQFQYVVVHNGVELDPVPYGRPFGEYALEISRRKALFGQFQIWLKDHWERAGQGFRGYQPLMTIKV